MNSINTTLYSREGCTLCKEAYYLLRWLADEYPLNIQVVDITTDPDLELRYSLEIPVLEIEGNVIAVSMIEEYTVREYLDSIRSITKS